MQKIKDAQKVKQEKFGRYADEAMKFFDGSHDWMWKGEYAKAPGGFLDKEAQGALPNFRMTVNRVFEAVALFGPVLYHRNPVIQVTPRIGPDIAPEALGINPADQMMSQSYDHFLTQESFIREIKRTHSSIKEHYLNWLQHEADKKVQARRAITDYTLLRLPPIWSV